jgi:hypothetical protein
MKSNTRPTLANMPFDNDGLWILGFKGGLDGFRVLVAA